MHQQSKAKIMKKRKIRNTAYIKHLYQSKELLQPIL